jgi:hypothetical protein
MKKIIPILLITVPLLTRAAGITDLIDTVFAIVQNILIPLAFSLCLFYFFWGIAKYIRTGAGDEKTAKEGKEMMIWGVVGLFIAFSIWGIISFMKSELGVPDVANPSVLQS